MSQGSFCCAPTETTSFQDFSRQHYLTTLEYMKNIRPSADEFDYCMELIDLYSKYNGKVF